MLITQNPFPQFFDTAGKPLTDGRIYFGVAGQNPRTSPVAIYTDAAGTQPIAQPVRTLGGYAVRNGSPVNIYTPGTYSVAVYTASGTLVAYAPDSAAFDAVLSATTAFTRSLLDDPDAATARATLGAASLGANTFAGAQTLPGNAVNALEAVPKQQLDASPGRLLAVRVFTTANSGQTYTPTAGASSFIVEVQAPGGGSGGAPTAGAGGYSGSAGGGAGSYAKCRLTAAQIGAGQVMTIPTGGTAGGAGSTTGGNGGTASFGALISCPGGKGSASYGPTASTVTVVENTAVAGAPSTTGTVLAISAGQLGGPAVGSIGGVARGLGGASMSGNYGAGANGAALGASASAVAGNAGGDAIITVWEFA